LGFRSAGVDECQDPRLRLAADGQPVVFPFLQRFMVNPQNRSSFRLFEPPVVPGKPEVIPSVLRLVGACLTLRQCLDDFGKDAVISR